ncbi:hypothetical protein O181_117379, partial [Austropuccinia psidii MF-1]|nr:hypothetical protein [Austropuccinia psidii MF-1]
NLEVGLTSINEVVSDWVFGQHECAGYDPANIEVSHFTQVVWKDTLRLGCWRKMCPTVRHAPDMKNAYYWICRYDPPGNVEGEYPQNVKAKKGQCPPRKVVILFVIITSLLQGDHEASNFLMLGMQSSWS